MTFYSVSENQEVFVTYHLPINSGELVDDEDPSDEFPCGRWLRRKKFRKEVKKGRVIDISITDISGQKQPRWGVKINGRTGDPIPFSDPDQGMSFFFSEEEARDYLDSLPNEKEEWVAYKPIEEEYDSFADLERMRRS